jgi:hypothetical protein
MNIYGVLATAAAVAALTSCGPPKSYDVVKLGPDTYSVSATAFQTMGGVSAARTVAVNRGTQYCQAAGLEFLATNISSQMLDLTGSGTVDVTFRCLRAGDPELQRPIYQRSKT